jgi:hypothetical protein
MNRDRVKVLFVAVAVLLLAIGGWWLLSHTEWADRPVWRGATGEAKTNPVYAAEQLLRRLGMTAEHRDTMTALPPQHGRLVILSDDWSAVPGQSERLHTWVKQGGHLVLMSGTAWRSTPLADWVPVGVKMVDEGARKTRKDAQEAPNGPKAPKTGQEKPQHEDPADADEDEDEASEDGMSQDGDDADSDEGNDTSHESYECKDNRRAGSTSDGKTAPAGGTAVSASASAPDAPDASDASPTINRWKQCGLFQPQLRLKRTGPQVGYDWLWDVIDTDGHQALRLPVGDGTVTVLNSAPSVFMQTTILDCDHAPLLTQALQAEAGATAWFYLSETREALLPWLWHQGWIAVVLGALTLAAALWRQAVRFGPALPTPPRLRRSIGEQVRGMGHYLMRQGCEALLLAQQRALESTAGRRLVDYSRHPLPDRARRIAQATGVSEHDLLAALSARFCTRAELPARLQILELARRRLQTHSQERPSR